MKPARSVQRPDNRHRRVWLLLLASLSVLAGCSALSLAYMNAPALGVLRIDSALDLPQVQRDQLADAAADYYSVTNQWARVRAEREAAAAAPADPAPPLRRS